MKGTRNEIAEQIDKLHAEAAATYSSIRQNSDLSDTAKLRKRGEAHEGLVTRHRELVAKYESERTASKEEARKDLFEPPIPMSARRSVERERFIQSARDAALRVMDIDDRATFDKYYDLAERLGDRQLQHAVFVRALEVGYGKIVERYVQANEHLASALETYRRDEDEDLFQRAFMRRAPEKPAELVASAATAGRR